MHLLAVTMLFVVANISFVGLSTDSPVIHPELEKGTPTIIIESVPQDSLWEVIRSPATKPLALRENP